MTRPSPNIDKPSPSSRRGKSPEWPCDGCSINWGDATKPAQPGHHFLRDDPENPLIWEGYAEYCLFLGRPADDQEARRQLLRRFSATAEFRVAEGIGRACLLLPATPEETRAATAMIDRALVEAKTGPQAWVYPYFMFAKGLAEYRNDRHDKALAIMRGEASRVLKPGPQLIEAMALHRSGRRDEARKTLAAATSGYDWKDARIDDREAWMYHALRREAVALIGSSEVAEDEPARAKAGH